MIELKPFQIECANTIADRCCRYLEDPLMITQRRPVPFYQNLSSITGSGKTLILADAVQQIRSYLSIEPIILWLSKGKVVVSQTLANLSTGGKYSHLIDGFEVKPLLDCKPSDVSDATRGLLLVATVAKFNQKDKDQGDRKIFQVCLDNADQSLWDLLGQRLDSSGHRRPLLIVYDEGHNLSDQQTRLLLELAPDALIAASATSRVPQELSSILQRLRTDKGWTDEDFVTPVRSSDVVDAQLVKKHILLGGYISPMEIAIHDMLKEMAQAEEAATALGLRFRPKAIYVSNTNTIDGSTIASDMARPFDERMARPILIWRHLVASGVDPSEIAVYCDLKFHRDAPPPPDFRLFAGGDADYDEFIAGDYRHIIFNLSLQEGWDDPECGFAYIDKDMGSPDQVTQVVGRVLRQPGIEHYPASILNTAHFYVRTDEHGVFEEILSEIERRLVAEVPEVSITTRRSRTGGGRPTRSARKHRVCPAVSINAAEAHEPVKKIVSNTIDFTDDEVNVVGKGRRIHVLRTIGSGENARASWVELDHSNPVTARWVFLREIQKTHPKAAQLCDIEDPKFDVFLEYQSPAAEHIREQARKVVADYLEHSVIVQNNLDHPYTVGSVYVDESTMVSFRNALHEGYSGLNALELEFAKALDKTGLDWCRNPSQGGYGIPLLSRGKTRTFFPDFLIWTEHDGDEHVLAIDTKGEHLLIEDLARKLFYIEKLESGPEVSIRLISEGNWYVSNSGQPIVDTPDGYTMWTLKHGKIHPFHCTSATEAVQKCLQSVNGHVPAQ